MRPRQGRRRETARAARPPRAPVRGRRRGAAAEEHGCGAPLAQPVAGPRADRAPGGGVGVADARVRACARRLASRMARGCSVLVSPAVRGQGPRGLTARAMSSLGSTQSADRLLYWRVGTCVHATSARCPLGARPHLPEFVVWMCPVVVGPCHALPTLRSGADGLNLRARVAAHSPSNAPISGHSCVNRSSKALLCHKCSQRSRPRQREANGRCQSLRMRACMVLQTHAQNKHAHRPSVLLRCWPLDLPLPRLPSLPARRHI